MSNNVDLSEVVNFSNDLQEASSDIKASLDSVREQIEKINAMDSFSGKAAKEAKNYFGDFHSTILESFRGLFDELEENLRQHINTFESDVDSSDSAVVKSNYLQEVQEEINEAFEDLKKQDEIIHDTIQKVSDISSANPPSFSDVNEWKNKTDKKIQELDEDLDAFTGESDETDVKAIMSQIERAMSNAKASEGKARFSNFEGASQQSELAELKAFNEDKKKADEEKVENLDNHSKFFLKQAQEDYKNQDIDKATYESLRSEIMQNGWFFIQNAKENNLSRNVSEQVQKDVSEWANKAYDNDHKISSSKDHQDIDPYHSMLNPDLLFPLTYQYHNATIKNSSNITNKKNKEKSYLDKMKESETNELNQEKDENVKDGAGSIVWKEGNKEISRGEKIDREELKKLGDLESTTVNGHEVNYMEKDGEFIIFKDNPDLTYYTNGAEMGEFNYQVADAAQLAAQYYSPIALGKFAKIGSDKINPIQNATDKFLNSKPGKVGTVYSIHKAEQNIPIVREILGTSIPEVGSKEVILYMSDDDGENWDSKVHFDVDKHGHVEPRDFSDK